MRKTYLIILILALFSCKTAQESSLTKPVEATTTDVKKSVFPKSVGVVNDFEEVFTTEEKHQLENLIINYEKETTNEIAVVSISSIKPYDDISSYTNDLANYWGVGKKEKDNGLIIVFSKELKIIRISTGYGTEKVLTDEKCKEIIDNVIVPELKNKNYFDGIKKGIIALMSAWK